MSALRASNPVEYSSMSLADLKLACAAQGLPKTGPKAKLINFLEHPELYAKPAKKQKTVAPAPADKPLAKPPAKPLVDRAARPTRATGGDAIIDAADDDGGGEGEKWSNDAVSLYWTREDVVTEQEDPNDRFVGRKTRTLAFSGAVKTRVLPCELQNVLARELGAPGLFLGETKCVKCGALEYVARPGDVNELQDVLSLEAFLTAARAGGLSQMTELIESGRVHVDGRRLLRRLQLAELRPEPVEAELRRAVVEAVAPPGHHVHHVIGARRLVEDALEHGGLVVLRRRLRRPGGHGAAPAVEHVAVGEPRRGLAPRRDDQAPLALWPRHDVPAAAVGVALAVEVRPTDDVS